MEEILKEITETWDEFQTQNAKFVDKQNKAAAGRARKATSKLSKLFLKYRKESVEAAKQISKRKKA